MDMFKSFILLCAVLISANIQAATITATPILTTGPFASNVFHTASSGSDGQNGSILAWFNLAAPGLGEANSWDASSGAFELHVSLFSNSADAMSSTNIQGSAAATGVLKLADLQHDGGLFGFIDWTFDASAVTLLGASVGLDANNHIQLFFEDTTYGSTGANGFTDSSLTLWGADGYDPGAADLVVSTNTLGMDLVAHVVPVPAALWLMMSGLLALAGVMRKRA